MGKKWIIVAIVLLAIPTVVAAQGPLVGDAFQRPGPLWGSNSLFAIGPTAAGVIFVESDGSIDPQTENWTIKEKNNVIAEINAGIAWWTTREPRANFTFTIEYSLVNTSYEPIDRPHTDNDLWIVEVLKEMGYTGASAVYLADDYNNDLIARHGTDWAFTIFVVDSSSDVDGMFTDGRFAYAILGGPYMVMTYGNDGYGINRMDHVTAHEVGHIFRALNQSSSGHDCEATSGYLNVPNHNSVKCPWTTYPSIMKWPVNSYSTGLVDRYARGQIGWWDWNCNNVLDPVDPDVETDYCFRVYLPLILSGAAQP